VLVRRLLLALVRHGGPAPVLTGAATLSVSRYLATWPLAR
jgi:hypothetical protein